MVTDLEGRRDAIDDLVDAGRMRLVDGALDFVDPYDGLYFAGDVTDRGPYTIRLVDMLLALRRRHPGRVAWAHGNLDLKNLVLLRDLPLLERGTPDYEAWLCGQPDSGVAGAVPVVEGSGGPARGGGCNTLDRRIDYWLTRQGAARAFEFHWQELGEIHGRPVTRGEAAEDYVARLQPGGSMFEFLRLGQVAILHGNVLIDHGGVSQSNIGFVPGATSRIAHARQWITALNAYGREQMGLIERAIRSPGGDGSFPDAFIRYADAIWDANAREGSGALFMNDVSLIYPFRQRERGNFRVPDEAAIAYLRDAGIDTEIVGHSPFGDLPGPLKADGFLRLMADTSHRRAGARSTISIDVRGGIRVRGMTSRGISIAYRVAANSPPPIGMVTRVERYTVVGRTRVDGGTRFLVSKYFDGHNIRDQLVDRATLASMQPEAAVARSELEDPRRHFDLLVTELQRRGKRVLTLGAVEALIGDRRPVVVSGFSKFGHSPFAEGRVEDEALALVAQLASPLRDILITGGTDLGFERAVHRLARASGYEIIGFIQQGAIAGEIDLVDTVAFAGAHQDWSAPLLAALTLAEEHGGYAVFVGGGSIVSEGIAHAAQIGLPHFLVRRSADAVGDGGASAHAASMLPAAERRWRVLDTLHDLAAARRHPAVSVAAGGTEAIPAAGPQRVGVFAGSFDPPHAGHRDLVRRMREQFALDLVYVVPDIVPSYKRMLPLAHRMAMTRLLFDGEACVQVLQADADDRFGGGELSELLAGVRQRHPRAKVFALLGSDALRWYAGLPPEQRLPGVQILANDRHDGASLPSLVDGQPVHTIDDLDRGLSSTAIRQALQANRPVVGLPPGLVDYIRMHGLYPAGTCTQVDPS
ncbi:nicotinate-nicotinamide nucleotide adenylyltransferase [Accumulibacter sp.]|uniref:nicotinate-nicotinamide nucleotide adenylyltransferase n=1 Tax=Accumulibacter sp. TaxID=2053492 RepID=UPI0025E46E8C|nr:nicotinate-nicotinamide nucleotide adenylyltransferase [Accumulibacter sp.]MCM8611257.1 nicotinate-nicotinamide nucleotide adenylyltransferase [Accumulibacter sp.]MCM8635330.1 nicotinate-nicotinamide nucleotide adenylyltransferase [Accumulibacter sp.]MCM8638739.1 nicotinate-nicotinamide nucleotide adenylyltransferase [Accumulibacter sp.]